MLGALLAGCGFVPLNPNQPLQRNINVAQRAGLEVLVVGEDAMPHLREMLASCPAVRAVVAPFPRQVLAEFACEHRQTRFFLGHDRASAWITQGLSRANNDTLAYVMFTSGSTGEPKGVPVSNGNVIAYVNNVRAMIQPDSSDRFAQCSDLTFDLSVHPVWLCWECGGTLCVVPEKLKMAPAKFIKEKAITIWTSVPSVVTFLKRLHLLPPGAFPTIRHSMFCGEPLTTEQVAAWQIACPESIIDNFYGPTEATCAITSSRCERPLPASAAPNGIVAIGKPFSGQRVALVNEALQPVPAGETGELLLSGSQVTRQYLGDAELTATKYVRVSALGDALWYRTGDLVRADRDGCMYFVGRGDLQIKVLGFRVELQEIEAAVREACQADSVACIPWPVEQGTARGVHCFTVGGNASVVEKDILAVCRSRLPYYMVPQRIHRLPEMPLSQNGKIDRKELVGMLAEKAA